MEYIARIHSDFPTKFGIPRQSGLTDALISKIVRAEIPQPGLSAGIEQWSHLWLLWHLRPDSKTGCGLPTVAPPKLGERRVWACLQRVSGSARTRLGCRAKLAGVELPNKKTVRFSMLRARTLPTGRQSTIIALSSVCRFASGRGGRPFFAPGRRAAYRRVPGRAAGKDSGRKARGRIQALSQNPRPGYQHDPTRRYGFSCFRLRRTLYD